MDISIMENGEYSLSSKESDSKTSNCNDGDLKIIVVIVKTTGIFITLQIAVNFDILNSWFW
jgi:hypothetical protein